MDTGRGTTVIVGGGMDAYTYACVTCACVHWHAG